MENLGNILPNNIENLEPEKTEQLHYGELSPEQLKIVDNFCGEVIMSGREEKLAAFVNIPLELHTAVAERFIQKNSTRHMVGARFVLNNLEKFSALDYMELAHALGSEYIFDSANEDVLDKFPDHNALVMHFLSIEELAQNYGQSNFLKFLAKRIKDLRDINFEPLMPKFFNLLANSYFAEQATNVLKIILEDQGKNFHILNYVLDAAKINPEILSLTYLWERCKNELEEKEIISLSELEILMSANDLVITDWCWQHQEKLKAIESNKLAALFLPVLEGRKGIAESLLEFQNPGKYKELQERRSAEHFAPRRRKKRPDGPLFFGAETNIMVYEEIKFPAELEKILANFPDLNEQELLNSLLETKPTFILNHLELFSNIDLEVKHKILASLMEKDGGIKVLLNQFDFFKEFHNEKLALQLVEIGENTAEFVLDNLANFSDLDHTRLVQVLIDKNYSNLLDRRYKELNLGLDQQSLDDVLKKNALRFSEYFIVRDLLEPQDEIDKEKQAQQIFSRLKEKSSYWQDQDNVVQPFENGAQYFGYEKMWEYVSRHKLSRHDALHNFSSILGLAKGSGLEAKQFFYQILAQVKKDDAGYYEGTAHHHLNMIANNISLDIEAVLSEAKKYQDIQEMQQALQGVDGPGDVFASWKTLKKYADIFQLLKKKEILDELVALKQTGQLELFNYVEKLAFHPNVDLKAVMQFWRQPDEFLDVEEIHATSSHERKKPSRYTNIPNLDLSAEDLRDALVEGDYDSMQAFEPLSIEYIVRDLPSNNLSELIKQALGSRSLGIAGQARDAKKLFAELNTILKTAGLNINTYLQASNGEELKLSGNMQTNLVNKLFDQQIGLVVKTKKYRAQVHLKSDPDAVVAGNDTSCCMPFGSGKNNVYTFNPITSLFTVQVETEDGHWRTVAQSVLTRDKDIGVQVDELIDRLDNEHTNMNEVIPEDILRQSQGIITCDNVELAKNFVDVNFGPVIEDIYRDFFQEYTVHFAQKDDLDAQRVIIGPGYSDSLTHLPRTANYFVPEAPVGYSDNVHAESLVLNLKAKESLRLSHRAIHMQTKLKAEQFLDTMTQRAVLPKGVDYLTFKDSLSVAYIEGKAYHDNQTLMQYLHNMENALIAKDVSNTFKNRPNMSLQYRDTEGKTHAYMLAYEGKKDKDGEDLLYVADLASDGHARAGASLVLGFVELYKKNYLAKDELKPIYAQLREQTSYKLVMNQLDKISKSMGIKFEVEELSAYEMGDDTMHEVILRPVKI